MINIKDSVINNFKTRLVSTNRKSGTFFNQFSKTSHSIDLFEFENQNMIYSATKKEENISLQIAMNSKKFVIKNSGHSEKEDEKRKINLCKLLGQIMNKAKLYNQEKNVDALFLGTYFIEGVLANTEKEYFRAPLMFTQLRIEKINTNRYELFIEDEKIINNSLLSIFANKNNKTFSILDISDQKKLGETESFSYFKSILKSVGIEMIDLNSNWSKSYNNELRSAPKGLKSELFKEFISRSSLGLNAYTCNYAALGVFDIASSTILSAYDEMEDPDFLEEISSEVHDSFSKDKAEWKTNEIKTISNMDYTQKRAVINSLSNSSYIFGPPGTGKSQTIVNILANIIDLKQRAIFVTEKKVASTVVYDKMNKLNLFVLMLHNNEKASNVHNKIKETVNIVLKNINNGSYVTERTNIDIEIDNIFKKLNEYKALFKTDLGKRYLTLISNNKLNHEKYSILENELDKLEINEIDLILGICSDDDIENVNKLIESLNEIKLPKTMWRNLFSDDSIEYVLFNWITLGKQKSRLGLFKKKKFNQFKTQDCRILNLLNMIKNNDDKLVLLKFVLSSLDKSIKINSLLDIKFLFIKKYKKINENLINFYNSDWNSKIAQYNKTKVLFDTEQIYADRIEWIIYIIQTKTYNDANDSYKEKKLQTLFNDMVRKIESTKTNVRLKTWFKRYYPIMELLFPIIFGSPEVMANHKLIPLEKGEFEFALFDEASQIYTEKCIPSMFRAKKYIVSGDDKQLSPSSFFSSRGEQEIDEDEIDNLELENQGIADLITHESLIDLAKGRYKKYMLQYHYRSKSEPLIAFSNSRYYENKLKVVNSNDANDRSIECKNINGTWINNTNDAEAKEIVKYIIDFYSKELNQNKSLGVITFNSPQQKLITDLLEKESAVNNNVFKQMNLSNGTELFIKNIENVQGDERDIILFSIGYAKNEKGLFRNSFGSLSQFGGEKRLNVAITRAKEKMIIFKSINSEVLNIKQDNLGPKHFKEFLRYVELLQKDNEESKEQIKSLLNIDQNLFSKGGDGLIFDSEFEVEVFNFLESKLDKSRYELKTQVETSGFYLDQAIFDKNLNKFILAIECDGWAYHSSDIQVQRDFERQSYLESRGWQFVRIPSTLWWSEEKYKDKLWSSIEKILHIDKE
ncbi:hypothetical protein STIUS_v1c00930 [Spiroplasma sp. TIUS-1]|uniref:AAA domain-containing protein n=1 Tax=Spiroplasma sp. TIUS-1 TaxID=216963 RepID=UPI001396F296|nr:AAA domain-containing protein [Spiroplasma sp. TIUS-1]QHX35648.1 hypothetical protein STIUS_v1c00930 [Spiroplasma sp. TIUS-1]